MKQFLPTYLYIKTHNKTGLKYFGKTSNDPYDYRGSGKHWLAHIKKHGNDVSTEILGYYTIKEECQQIAEEFSIKNNIIESKEWANLILENGLDGGNTNRANYAPHSEETKRKLSESNKGRLPWNTGKTGVTPGNTTPRSEKTKQLLREANLGKKRSQASIQKTADKLRGRKRPEVGQKLKGIKRSSETIAKMKAAQQRKRPVSEETKQKIREARKHQVITEETKKKLSGQVIVIDKNGNSGKIPKDQYYSQTGPKQEWQWVSHKSKEALKRKP